jgi:ribosome biogenesis protein MAK21
MSLEDAVKDMLPNLKDKAMKTVFILLKSKSEQERRLLTTLVNKLGDPERRAASSAAYLLTCLLAAHPNMKMVVIDEVDSFLFRPHVGLRAKYQAVNFLSQILLTHKGDGPKIAKRLVDVYIALFKVLMSSNDTKGDTCSKYSKKM